ncbi:hypothetical protein NUITMVS1_40730 [Shewanella xiamenensis]|nr:hypothetical protein NUITMVS1_40730 [Shewanella xiamenensis]
MLKIEERINEAVNLELYMIKQDEGYWCQPLLYTYISYKVACSDALIRTYKVLNLHSKEAVRNR